jgi:hypothetical protein
MTYDNVKGNLIINTNTSKYGSIEIRDWFGLLSLAKLELKKNTDICGVNCNSETQIILYQDSILIDDVKFVGAEVKDYKFYIQIGETETGKIINDYGEVCKIDEKTLNNTCSYGIIGTHSETTPIWEEYKLGT